MNYSTLKKTVAVSCVSLMAVGAANAQMMSDTSKSAMMSTAKVFGGAGQYNTWSLGVSGGLTSPLLASGGQSPFKGDAVAPAFGISVKDEIAHSFGIQFNFSGGDVKGADEGHPLYISGLPYSGSKTTFYQASFTGVVHFATVNYMHRKNAIEFYGSAGGGLIFFTPHLYQPAAPKTELYPYTHSVTDLVVPVGVGVKFKLTDALALNLGYTENFIDDDNFYAIHSNPTRSRYAYGYGGLEYTFGPKSKPNLEWVNPVAMLYDELYDEALRQEVAALKGRVSNVENAVKDLKKDSDGDGVSDQFDKCPNTPAGTIVDGSGCAIKFPPPIDTSLFMRKPIGGSAAGVAFSNIQFEFDSSVLRTSSYPALDATSADLRSSGATITIAGYASSEGTAAHNLRLSKDRANSVKTYLVNSGVEAKKLKVKGYGETHPIANNDTEEGRVTNRRVEFKK